MTGRVSKSALFATLPPPWPRDLRHQIRAMLAARPEHKLVVLDDDPTGTQTVQDVPVLTTWEVESLRRELTQPAHCFYILTNSRSLPPKEAAALNRTIARNLRKAVWQARGFAEEPEHSRQLCGQAFTLVSRSDSTLRGHYPLETEVLSEELGPFDATILIPYFDAGGRYTIHDTHYVAEGDTLVPVAETPFARDVAFGYRSSNLAAYVEEKTNGRIKADQVVSFSISELRTEAPRHEPTREVVAKLLGLKGQSAAIVNACVLADAEFFALATLWAEKAGGRYLFRTAAQFVSARLGLEPQPLWKPKAAAVGSGGGLTVIGSHVPRTTEQLQNLLATQSSIVPIELSVASLLVSGCEATIGPVVERLNRVLAEPRDVVLFTSRQLVTGTDAAESLAVGARVSAALAEIVHRLEVRPRYLIAKGGITSSDLATKGLGVKRAMVRGQLLPGVPVWEVGEETRFPGMTYIVFPGNVGGPTALAEAIQRFKQPISGMNLDC